MAALPIQDAWLTVFSSRILNMISHCFAASVVSAKLAVNLVGIPL